MNPLSAYLRMPADRRVDISLVIALLANAVTLCVIAAGTPQAALGTGIAAAAGLAGLWGATRGLERRDVSPVIALALVAMVLAQIALAANPRLWALNALLTLSLLPTLRRGGVVLAAGALFALGGPPLFLAREQITALTDPRALALSAFIVIQALLLARLAQRNRPRTQEHLDIESLVRAMGVDGPIRLGLDAVKAQSTLGGRLTHVQHRMVAAIRQAHRSVRRARDASQELDANGRALHQRTGRCAAGLRDAATALEQISATVHKSAQAARAMRELAAAASQEAAQGGALFTQATARMHDIDAAAHRITDVLGVTDGIVPQARIVALDAAAEIKSLAGASLDTVRTFDERVAGAGQRLTDIVESAHELGRAIDELSSDTHAHAGRIDAVTQAVMALEAMTRENVAVAETTRGIARTLLDQGSQLEQELNAFKLGDSPPAPAPTRGPVPSFTTPPMSASGARQLMAATIETAAQPRQTAPPTKPGGGAGNNVTCPRS